MSQFDRVRVIKGNAGENANEIGNEKKTGKDVVLSENSQVASGDMLETNLTFLKLKMELEEEIVRKSELTKEELVDFVVDKLGMKLAYKLAEKK